jgi:hypothetical protein
MSVPHNIVMDMNNVMSPNIGFLILWQVSSPHNKIWDFHATRIKTSVAAK